MRSLSHEYESTYPALEIKKAVDYIFEHYTERIDVERLASLVFFSRRQLERRFQQVFHLSPKDFICKIRIDTAIRLLIDSDLSITQIALETGFYDNSDLTRHFKRMVGLSPLQFRKKYATFQQHFPDEYARFRF
jgi:transcriptional regulator GlxA family with amidase domain